MNFHKMAWRNSRLSKINSSLLILTSAMMVNFGLDARARSLVSKNPFLPPNYKNAAITTVKPSPQSNGPISRQIEFRGLMTLDNVTQFSLFNKNESKSYWLRPNQIQDGIIVSSYDKNTKALTVSMNGRTEVLVLMNKTSAPLPVVASYNQPINKSTRISTSSENKNTDQNDNRRVIPRRRVILPKQ